jgi:hypothetical protein
MPTEWAVVTFDKKTTPAQRRPSEDPRHRLPGEVGRFSTREDSITWQDDAKAPCHDGERPVGDLAGQDRGVPDRAPVVVKNLQYWFSTSNEASAPYSKHRFNGFDDNPAFLGQERRSPGP